MERNLPHTSDDDDTRYRAKEELEEAKKRDPVVIFKDYLVGLGIVTEDVDQRFRDDARREVDEATDVAEAAPYPETTGFYDHVYSSSRGEASP